MSGKEEKIIGFRLDGELRSRLEEAALRNGISLHEWARKAVIRELESESYLPKIALQNEALKQELLELRKDIAVSTEALLVSAGKSTPEHASKFVRANLKRE